MKVLCCHLSENQISFHLICWKCSFLWIAVIIKTSKYGFDGCLLSLTVWFVNIPHCSALKRFVFHFLGMTWYWWRWWFLTHVPASVSGRSFILYQIKEMIYISMIYMSKWGNSSSSMPWDLFESLQTEIRLLWGFLWSPNQSSSCSSV